MLSPFLKKIKNDTQMRIQLFLFLSVVFNFTYALFLFIISRVYFSKWFFVMSIYYALLSTARIFIFFQNKPENHSLKKILMMRACGYYLLLLNLVVSLMMFLLIYTAPYVQHHEITVITLATYTFSALTIAIIGGVRYLKRNNYVYSCVKVISLISTSVSMLTLTNTMLATFGDDNGLLRSIILPILSGIVSIFIIVCAILMIKKANYELRVLKNEQKRK